MSIFSRKKRLASITIEDDAIRYVRLKSIEPLIVDSAEEVPLPANVVVNGKIVDAETIVMTMEEAVKRWGIAKRSISFLAPDSYVIIRQVAYPNTIEENELKGYFFIEIGSTIYLPFDDPVFDVVPYKQLINSKEHQAILIASKESILKHYEEVFEEVKLDPTIADITPLALYRLAMVQHAFQGNEHVLIADLNGSKLTVSIFHEHYPLFMRPIDLEMSVNLANLEQADNAVIPPSSIVMELEKLTNFYQYNLSGGESVISHLLINGAHPELDLIITMTSNRLSIQVHPLVKQPVIFSNGETVSTMFNRVIGLALKEV